MNQDDTSHLRELIETHKRRLQGLEIQAARFGDRCDPQILNEIGDIQLQIDILERSLRDNFSGLYIHKKDTLSKIIHDINTVEKQISEVRIEKTKVYKLFGIVPIWTITDTVIQIVKLLLLPIGPGLIAIFMGYTMLTANLFQQPINLLPIHTATALLSTSTIALDTPTPKEATLMPAPSTATIEQPTRSNSTSTHTESHPTITPNKCCSVGSDPVDSMSITLTPTFSSTKHFEPMILTPYIFIVGGVIWIIGGIFFVKSKT